MIQRLFEIELAAEAYGDALNRYSVNTIRHEDRTIESSDLRHELLVRARELLFLLRNTDLEDLDDIAEAKAVLTEHCSFLMTHASTSPFPELEIKEFQRQLTGCQLLAKGVQQARLDMPGGANTAIPNDLITQTRAGEITDVDRSTICRLVKKGALTGFGKHNSVSRAELESIKSIRKRRRRTVKGNLE